MRFEELNERISYHYASAVALRREIHAYPEVAYSEYRTTERIRHYLTYPGIIVEDLGIGTGLCALVVGKGQGKNALLRADIDALPVTEETGLPYASEIPGQMHACGHDFHTAALLAAAVMLKEQEDRLPGKALLVFQPAEELSGGGKQIASTGITDDAQVFVALHTHPPFSVGTLGIKEGPVMAAVDQFKVTVTGKGTHAGIPQDGIDPIPVLAELTLALQTIVSRRLSPFADALLSVTHLDAGTTWNVIPESGYLEGTIRTFDEDVRTEMLRQFRCLCEGICAAHDCHCEIWWLEGPPALHNDPALCAIARRVAENMGFRVDRQEDTMQGEDFAEFLRFPARRPGLFVRVGTGGTSPTITLKDTASTPASIMILAYIFIF